MALQVKRAGAEEYGRWVKALVLGNPGAGKTRTASTWPDVLYANCEGGMMSVADRQPATIDIETFGQIKELLGVLNQRADVRENLLGVPVKTVVVDTIDEIARILIKERLEAERKDAFAMQDWGWLGDQLRGMVRAFRNLDMHVVFNVHLKSQEDSETGRTYFKPAIQGAMSDELAAYVDLAMLMVAKPVMRVVDNQNVREVQRYFQTYPDAQHPWVKDRSGRLPMEFEVNFEDDFERLHNLIYANLPAVGSNLGTIETPEEEPVPEPAKRTTGPKAAKPDKDHPTLDTVVPDEALVQDPTPPERDPAPEPDVTEPEDPQEPASTPEPETVPETGTDDASPEDDALEEWERCNACSGRIESKDQADLSFIRYKENLCRSCFAAKKKQAAGKN